MASICKMMKWVCVILYLVKWVSADHERHEIDALIAFKQSLQDPHGALESWNPNSVDPCTFFHVTCDDNNHVKRIDIGMFNLSGKLVPDLVKLESLHVLELYHNNIQGPIPAEFGKFANLVNLDLYNNNITGIIPPELGNIKSLGYLRLNGNHLHGPIPNELTNLSNLRLVDFSSNDLCGAIPTAGPFKDFPPENFKNNPRLGGPNDNCKS